VRDDRREQAACVTQAPDALMGRMTRGQQQDFSEPRSCRPEASGLDGQACRDDFAISYIVIDAFGWEMLTGSI
jgi:hypothetical protein